MMRLAFYKAYRGNWLDWLIAAYDFGKYSHVELVFSDGTCFSSSPRSKTGDGKPIIKGTRFVKIDDLETSGKWDLVDLPNVTQEQEVYILRWATKEVMQNKGYDYGGVLHFVAPFITQRQDKWFCSEVVVTAIQSEGYWPDWNASDVSPNGLWQIVHGSKPRRIPWVGAIKAIIKAFNLGGV